MHRLYVRKYEEWADSPLVKYGYYSKVFNEDFNLYFGQPKTDTCGTCEEFKVKLTSLQEGSLAKKKAQDDKAEHLRCAERFYADLHVDTELAKKSEHVRTISFDFQQNLPLPHLPVGELFYMQQMWLYVFGIHSCGDNDVAMYCWPETTAKRGSDEVVSSLHTFLSKLPPEVDTLRLYSDGCGGQNKNSTVMQYLFTLVSEGKFRHIRHYFPVTGHSFLPNDRDFGRTELNKRKNERVYSPEQWLAIIKGARQRKPFQPVLVDQSIFLPFSSHFSSIFKKIVKSKKKSLNIQKARILDYSVNHVSEVWVKYTGSETEEWSKFSLLKKSASPSLPLSNEKKYNGLLPLKASKAADIEKIVDRYVPTQFRAFYAVTADDSISDDSDSCEDNEN